MELLFLMMYLILVCLRYGCNTLIVDHPEPNIQRRSDHLIDLLLFGCLFLYIVVGIRDHLLPAARETLKLVGFVSTIITATILVNTPTPVFLKRLEDASSRFSSIIMLLCGTALPLLFLLSFLLFLMPGVFITRRT